MPQTAAPLAARIAALERLCRNHPAVGWRVCINQFDIRATFGDYSAKPQWRADAGGAGEPVSGQEAYRMARRALEIALAWPLHDEHTLGDLVERIDGIPDDQNSVWSAIRDWLAKAPSDAAKAKLREQIRRSTMVRPRKQPLKGKPPVSILAREVYEALEPDDVIWRHQWLFARHWVQESAEELHNGDLDFKKREARMEQRRCDAAREIWEALGLDGVRQICRIGDASTIIGSILPKILTPEEIEGVIVELAEGPAEQPLEQCLSGLLWSLSPSERGRIFSIASAVGRGGNRLSIEGAHRLMVRSPFSAETWSQLNKLPTEERARYWANVQPSTLFRKDIAEVNQATDELLNAVRPRAALFTAQMAFGALTTDRLVRLLTDVATVGSEPRGHYPLAQHNISEAFEVLSERSDTDQDTLARLEFLYVDGLRHTKHGIRNLERQLSASPSLFVQALALGFSRDDGKEDPPELKAADSELAQTRGQSVYSMLSQVRRLPGTNDKGELDARKLREWIATAIALAHDYGRDEIAEIQIGQILAHSPVGSDGAWPHEAVRDVLEDLGTNGLARGMLTGKKNARGAVWRGRGGDQEREIANEYRAASATVATQYPFTARLLDELARSYEHDAAWFDERELVDKRLHN